MDTEAGLKELFLARSQHSGCTDVEVEYVYWTGGDSFYFNNSGNKHT
jgi:hypothetical protein